MDPNILEKPGSDWTNLTYSWTASPSTGLTFNPEANVMNPVVTITKSTDNPSTVVLRLEVNQSGRTGHGVIDTMQIDVYDTPCKAAIGKGLGEVNFTDIDGDCITTLADFTEMASDWLDNKSLPSPMKK